MRSFETNIGEFNDNPSDEVKVEFFCITHYNQDAKHDHLLNE